MVMITQDGIDAILRFQTTQHLRARRGIMPFLGNVVAGERDDVGLKPVSSVDGALDLVAVRERSVMNIGKLNDAKAVERFRQATQLDALVFDAEHVRLGECGTSNMRQAKREGT